MPRRKRIFREWQHPRDGKGRFSEKGSAKWFEGALKAAQSAGKGGDFSMAQPGGPKVGKGEAFVMHTGPKKARPSTFELGPKSKSSSGADAGPQKRMPAPGARKAAPTAPAAAGPRVVAAQPVQGPLSDKTVKGLSDGQLAQGIEMHGTTSPKGRQLTAEAARRELERRQAAKAPAGKPSRAEVSATLNKGSAVDTSRDNSQTGGMPTTQAPRKQIDRNAKLGAITEANVAASRKESLATRDGIPPTDGRPDIARVAIESPVRGDRTKRWDLASSEGRKAHHAPDMARASGGMIDGKPAYATLKNPVDGKGDYRYQIKEEGTGKVLEEGSSRDANSVLAKADRIFSSQRAGGMARTAGNEVHYEARATQRPKNPSRGDLGKGPFYDHTVVEVHPDGSERVKIHTDSASRAEARATDMNAKEGVTPPVKAAPKVTRQQIGADVKRVVAGREGRAVQGVDMTDPNRWSADKKYRFEESARNEAQGFGGNNLLDDDRKAAFRKAVEEFDRVPSWETQKLDAAARKVQGFRDENQALKDDFTASRGRLADAVRGRYGNTDEAVKEHVKALKKANGIPGDAAIKKLPDGQRALAESIIFDAKNDARRRVAIENSKVNVEVLTAELAGDKLHPRTRRETESLLKNTRNDAELSPRDSVAERLAVWDAVRKAAADGDPGKGDHNYEVMPGNGISPDQALELSILGRRDGTALADRAAARLRGEAPGPGPSRAETTATLNARSPIARGAKETYLNREAALAALKPQQQPALRDENRLTSGAGSAMVDAMNQGSLRSRRPAAATPAPVDHLGLSGGPSQTDAIRQIRDMRPATAPTPGEAAYTNMSRHTLLSLARSAGVSTAGSNTDIAKRLDAADKAKSSKLNPSGIGGTPLVAGKPVVEDVGPSRGTLDRTEIGGWKGGRSTPAARTARPTGDAVNAALKGVGTREEGAAYLDNLKLSKAELKELAGELNVAITSNASAAEIKRLMVAQKVGHRLATDAILNPGGRPKADATPEVAAPAPRTQAYSTFSQRMAGDMSSADRLAGHLASDKRREQLRAQETEAARQRAEAAANDTRTEREKLADLLREQHAARDIGMRSGRLDPKREARIKVAENRLAELDAEDRKAKIKDLGVQKGDKVKTSLGEFEVTGKTSDGYLRVLRPDGRKGAVDPKSVEAVTKAPKAEAAKVAAPALAGDRTPLNPSSATRAANIERTLRELPADLVPDDQTRQQYVVESKGTWHVGMEGHPYYLQDMKLKREAMDWIVNAQHVRERGLGALPVRPGQDLQSLSRADFDKLPPIRQRDIAAQLAAGRAAGRAGTGDGGAAFLMGKLGLAPTPAERRAGTVTAHPSAIRVAQGRPAAGRITPDAKRGTLAREEIPATGSATRAAAPIGQRISDIRPLPGSDAEAIMKSVGPSVGSRRDLEQRAAARRVDTSRDNSQNGGMTTETTKAQDPYLTGKRVEVSVQNFDKPGFPMEWEPGTVEEHRVDDNGRVDMRVKLDKGGYAPRQIIGVKGGNRAVRPLETPAPPKAAAKPGEATLGVTESSKGRTTTITLPDGRTATRTSKTMTYSHVVVGTTDEHANARDKRKVADRLDAYSAALEAWIADGSDLSKLRRFNTGVGSYNDDRAGIKNYGYYLPGFEPTKQTTKRGTVYYQSTSDGPTVEHVDLHRDGTPVALTSDWQHKYHGPDHHRDVLKMARDRAADLRAEADKLEAGPQHSYHVPRWSQRADTAFSAIGSPEVNAPNTRYQVVTVGGVAKPDAKAVKVVPTAAEKAAVKEAAAVDAKTRKAASDQAFVDRTVASVRKAIADGRDPEDPLNMSEQGLRFLAKAVGAKLPRLPRDTYDRPQPLDRDGARKLIVKAIRKDAPAAAPAAPAGGLQHVELGNGITRVGGDRPGDSWVDKAGNRVANPSQTAIVRGDVQLRREAPAAAAPAVKPAGDSIARHTTAPVSMDIFEGGAGQLDIAGAVYDIHRDNGGRNWVADGMEGDTKGPFTAANPGALARKVADAHGVSGAVSIEDERPGGKATQRFEHTAKTGPVGPVGPGPVPVGATDAQAATLRPRIEGETDFAYSIRTAPSRDSVTRTLNGYNVAGLRSIARDEKITVPAGASKPVLVENIRRALYDRPANSRAIDVMGNPERHAAPAAPTTPTAARASVPAPVGPAKPTMSGAELLAQKRAAAKAAQLRGDRDAPVQFRIPFDATAVREQAKKLGATWDKENKTWHVPADKADVVRAAVADWHASRQQPGRPAVPSAPSAPSAPSTSPASTAGSRVGVPADDADLRERYREVAERVARFEGDNDTSRERAARDELTALRAAMQERGLLAARKPSGGPGIAPLDQARIRAAAEDYAAANHGGTLNLSRDDTARYVTEGHLQGLEKKYGTSTVQDAVRAHIEAHPDVLTGPKDGGRGKEAARKTASADVAEQARQHMKNGRYVDALSAIDRGERDNPDFTVNGVTWDGMRARIRTKRQEANAANLEKGRTVQRDMKVEQLRASTAPTDNAAKIKAIVDGRMGSVTLYRQIHAGPSGQRSNIAVGTVRHTPDRREGEYRVTDRDGKAAGWVTSVVRNGDQKYATYQENYDGGTELLGWADSLAHAADVLTNGEQQASTGGTLDHRRISGRLFERNPNRDKTLEQLDRESAQRERRASAEAATARATRGGVGTVDRADPRFAALSYRTGKAQRGNLNEIGYIKLNNHLRNPHPFLDNPELDAKVRDIDSVMAEHRTTRPVVLYRGVNDLGKSLGVDKTFPSASTDPAHAATFGGTLVRLTVQPGVGAVHLPDHDPNHPEHEVLLDRGLEQVETGRGTITMPDGTTREVVDVEVRPKARRG